MNGAVVVTIAGNIHPVRASATPDAAGQRGEDDETVYTSGDEPRHVPAHETARSLTGTLVRTDTVGILIRKVNVGLYGYRRLPMLTRSSTANPSRW